MMVQASQCMGDELNEVEDIFEFQDRSSQQELYKQYSHKIRLDMFNQEIIKNDKNHSISFRDDVLPNQGLVDITIIENWKDYNLVTEKDIRENCSCKIQ